MLKNALSTLFAIAIAIGVGGGSVWYALDAQSGVGAIRIGPWTAFPDIGTSGADPYTQARTAREGVLSLGRAEGLTFVADADSSGEPLRRECRYTIDGGFPTARFFTLYAADASLNLIATGKPRRAVLQSYQLLWRPDDTALIATGGRPQPGNWLAVTGAGPLYFVLSFYDTPIATSTGLSDVRLPAIRKAGCDA
jgi:hypothetical protein